MKIKIGPKEINLRRVRKIVKVGHTLAQIHFHTGEAMLVRCSVPCPDGMTFTYRGTVEDLQALLKEYTAFDDLC